MESRGFLLCSLCCIPGHDNSFHINKSAVLMRKDVFITVKQTIKHTYVFLFKFIMVITLYEQNYLSI